VSQTTSWLDAEPYFSTVKGLIEDGSTNSTIVAKLIKEHNKATSEASLRRFRKRHGLNPAAFDPAFTQINGDTAEASTGPQQILTDPDTMLRDRGLDPEEWEISGLRANEYEGPNSADAAKETGEAKIKYYQTRFNVVRKKGGWLEFPRTDGYVLPAPRTPDPTESRLVVVTGDQQAPFQDPHLHALFLEWLAYNQPDQGVLLGDTVDFNTISRHPADPDNEAFVNECIQTGYNVLRDYRESSIDTYWQKLAGNHDERIRNLLLNQPKTPALYGIRRASTPEEIGPEVLSLTHLLRLDELGIEYIDPHGAYALGQIVLSPKLAVRHGWLAKKGSGTTALATLQQLGYSVIVGHTHRQSIVSETKHEITGDTRVTMGVEAGCMCRVKQSIGEDGRVWPSYTPAPDWQQGFVTAQIWPDGTFNIDTAKFVNGTLMWRDQRYV
jgi:hypothetical protein